MSEAAEDVGAHIRVEGQGARKVGRITLDRPKAMNALTPEGGAAIDAALIEWAADPEIALVMIEGAGDKAFCAGGDIQKIYHNGRAGNFGFARQFWADEYRMNARISGYPKPFIAFMDGVTMGGGVGVSAHGSHRIVTERTLLAMPEAAIGLLPDAGGLWLLSRAPGRLGEYLGATGARLGAADAIHARFADRFMPAERVAEATEALIAAGDVAALEPFYAAAPESPLAAQQGEIDRFFAKDTPLDIIAALEADGGDWAMKTVKALRAGSPLIVAGSIEAVRRARRLETIQEALTLELRFNWRVIEEGDLLEGIRSVLIDKDRNPQWRPARLEDLEPGRIAAMFESLGANELTF